MPHVLDLSTVYSSYEQELINDYLSHLTIDNLRVFLIAPDVETDQIESLYQTPYGIKKLDDGLRKKWTTPISSIDLNLPKPNDYIAEKTALKTGQVSAKPSKIKIKEGLVLWSQLDTEFGVPRSVVNVSVHTPRAGADLQSRLYNEMFASLINDSLERENYPMRLAGVSMGVSAQWTGMTLKVSGYDEKQADMITKLGQHLISMTPDPERFELIKSRKIRAWKNLEKDRPIRIGGRAIDRLIYPRQFDRSNALESLEKTTLEGFENWRKSYFDSGSMRVYVYGNQTLAEAKAIAESTHKTLLNKSTLWIRPAKSVRQIPKGEHSTTLDIAHPDAIFLAKYQGKSGSIEQQSKYRLLAHLIKAPFFSELRTKQQLGYTVWAF